MEEVLVNIGEHAGGGLKRVVGSLEADVLGPQLVRSMAGEHGGDVEDDGSFLEG